MQFKIPLLVIGIYQKFNDIFPPQTNLIDRLFSPLIHISTFATLRGMKHVKKTENCNASETTIDPLTRLVTGCLVLVLLKSLIPIPISDG
jgi:hypothetical protein